jgi:hypothetical protein
MVPADLLSIRRYGATAISPDGQLIAVEVISSRSEDSSHHWINYITRSHLWVVRRDGSDRRPLLPDRASIVHSWQPVWSPTGRYLAFLWSIRHANAFVRVWDRRSGRVRRLDIGPVDMAASISRGVGTYEYPICWLDATHLAVVTLPDSAQALDFHEDVQSVDIAYRGLAALNTGRKVTAVVASSPPDSAPQPPNLRATLKVVDVVSGLVRRIGDMPAVQTRVAHRMVVLSHTGRFAAIIVNLRPSVADPHIGWTTQRMFPPRLGLASLTTPGAGIRWVSDIAPFITSPYHLPLSWMPNDSAFAFVSVPADGAETAPGKTGSPSITTIDPYTLTYRSAGAWATVADMERSDGLQPRKLEWTRNGQIQIRTWSSAIWVVHGDSVVPGDSVEPSNTSRTHTSTLNASVDGRLSLIDSSGKERTIFRPINPQIDAIQAPHFISFRYTNSRGDTLNATALLPYNYVEGRRYPTVVNVYASDVDGFNKRFAELNDDSNENVLLLAHHGYVVLKPSIPLDPPGIPSDPLSRLSDGVDPAVDHLIAMGVADSGRLSLIGASYGGYTVYGLLTVSQRYKAAVVINGISDIVSDYGAFDTRHRYSEPNSAAMRPFDEERAQMRMGVPPWIDPQRYVRNSPVFYADKVNTPLMIVQGSSDFLGAQNEEFFTALYRLGRRAEIVTYIGETHAIESPANIVDFWRRIFDWLDRYSRPVG